MWLISITSESFGLNCSFPGSVEVIVSTTLTSFGLDREKVCATWINASKFPTCTDDRRFGTLAKWWNKTPATSSSAICSKGSARPFMHLGWNMRSRMAWPAAADNVTLFKGSQALPSGIRGRRACSAMCASLWTRPNLNASRIRWVERGDWIVKPASLSSRRPNWIMDLASTFLGAS